MPEGDTIYRTAGTLRSALEGRTVTGAATRVLAVRSLGVQRVVGQTVAAVEPRGKHLLIWFHPSDLALHTHLGMTGSWHLYRSGERWRKSERLPTFRLDVVEWTAACFSAPTCELLSRSQVQRHASLSKLGPDALDAHTDLVEARRRLDERGGVTIAEALLDQRVLAGVGNVYKSEVLYLVGVHPWTNVSDVAPDVRDQVLATAERLLKANVRPGDPRRTTSTERLATGRGDRLYVYGRARRPCPRCRSPIRVARQGEQARTTYWCPRCQPATDGSRSVPHAGRG